MTDGWSDPQPLQEVASGRRAIRESARGYWIVNPRTCEQYDREQSLSQRITAALGTDDWVIVSQGEKGLVTDEELDGIEADE